MKKYNELNDMEFLNPSYVHRIDCRFRFRRSRPSLVLRDPSLAARQSNGSCVDGLSAWSVPLMRSPGSRSVAAGTQLSASPAQQIAVGALRGPAPTSRCRKEKVAYRSGDLGRSFDPARLAQCGHGSPSQIARTRFDEWRNVGRAL
jgi:hypothetical protein